MFNNAVVLTEVFWFRKYGYFKIKMLFMTIYNLDLLLFLGESIHKNLLKSQFYSLTWSISLTKMCRNFKSIKRSLDQRAWELLAKSMNFGNWLHSVY